MRALRIHGETRRLAESQKEYSPLSIRDERVDLHMPDGRTVPVNGMVAAFEPTPEEIAKINKGAPIALRILGDRWPPVSLFVGEVPE
jgi:hypothetical protein